MIDTEKKPSKTGLVLWLVGAAVILWAIYDNNQPPEIRETFSNIGIQPVSDAPELNVHLELDGCNQDGAFGTVKNTSDLDGTQRPTVNVSIDVQFLDSNGVVVDTGLDFISGLKGLQEATWDAAFLGDSYARCHAEVGDIYLD